MVTALALPIREMRNRDTGALVSACVPEMRQHIFNCVYFQPLNSQVINVMSCDVVRKNMRSDSWGMPHCVVSNVMGACIMATVYIIAEWSLPLLTYVYILVITVNYHLYTISVIIFIHYIWTI